MRVILDFRSLAKGIQTQEGSQFVAQGLLHLMKQRPDLDCFFLEKKPGRWAAGLGPSLASILRQYPADLLIAAPGISRFSLQRLKLPYALWVPGPILPGDPAEGGRRWQKSLENARVIFTDSASYRKIIIDRLSLDQERVSVLYGAADENYHPLEGQEKEIIKAQYARGKEYFLMTQADRSSEELVQVLKAFGIFKKKLGSNLQLLITGTQAKTLERFSTKRETFKYRDDLHFLDPLPAPEAAKLLAASYGFLQPFGSLTAVSLLNAFQCRVPVIIAPSGASREVAAEAALLSAGTDAENLAGQMILLYKDELLRNELIEKGAARLPQFGWEKNNTQLWEAMSRAVQ
jgi:glycosyltransferase involved in cell wall biosynthesis